MIVCVCHRVSDKDIHAAVSVGATCFSSLQDGTGVATQCGRCRECAHEVLQAALHTQGCGGHCHSHATAQNAAMALQAA